MVAGDPTSSAPAAAAARALSGLPPMHRAQNYGDERRCRACVRGVGGVGVSSLQFGDWNTDNFMKTRAVLLMKATTAILLFVLGRAGYGAYFVALSNRTENQWDALRLLLTLVLPVLANCACVCVGSHCCRIFGVLTCVTAVFVYLIFNPRSPYPFVYPDRHTRQFESETHPYDGVSRLRRGGEAHLVPEAKPFLLHEDAEARQGAKVWVQKQLHGRADLGCSVPAVAAVDENGAPLKMQKSGRLNSIRQHTRQYRSRCFRVRWDGMGRDRGAMG